MPSPDDRPKAGDTAPADLAELRRLSAAIGADPLLTQGAGGNTSVKEDGVLWIKASGTWLAHANERDIFVPVELEPLLEAVRNIDPAAEEPQRFTLQALNPSELRPSIETTVHGLMPQRVVLHVHSVDTIAWAVREDCSEAIAPLLEGLHWAFVPYARPGLPLAKAIEANSQGNPDVLILGNHGLVVAGASVGAANQLLLEVKRRVALEPRTVAGRSRVAENNSGYRLPASPAADGVALDPVTLGFAAGGSLYPDHVIFLGEGISVAGAGEDADAVVARLGLSPPLIVFPGEGVLMRADANAGADAMARCLADVCTRVPAGAPVRYLSAEEHQQLTNWDAEKYRQALNRQKGA
jgi:rhamnose utilization protein RhaD (predicted bifunctional aldolase and dehydrogenase)